MIQAKNLAQRGVGVGVRAAGDGNHRSQFGVAQAGKAAGEGNQDEGDRNGRPRCRTPMHQRAGGAPGAQEVANQVKHLGVQDGGRFEVLARRRGAGEHEDSGPNDGADAESGQRPGTEGLLEPVLGLVGLSDQFVDGLAAQQLVARVGGFDRRGRLLIGGRYLCQRVPSCGPGL